MKLTDLILGKRSGSETTSSFRYTSESKTFSDSKSKFGESGLPSSEDRLTEQQRLYISEYYLAIR
ncbi:hypothetical protein CH379_004500 [Leptospira ellisii]|uniref:Uncharacterized protein n=1 Tax=Leptospira ellisii TaxID=2023197 RepID=A0A2N0B4U3_9LEPT|nr:hypothetical protein [Leptospira ellisii]MDV6234889.1 hypothetical protein [Leptospira ellisii]PJZ91580.1 hypothetical protein CH379_17845 [Leptospira ellisii]PKA02986.1 hypothetical protein CH375_19685 [Leptospira ellisii]